MGMTVKQQMMHVLEKLPDEACEEMMLFASYLNYKYVLKTPVTSAYSYAQHLDLAQKKVSMRLDAIEKLYGSLMHVLPNSDDFARRKQEEIDLEEHHLAHRP